MRCAIFSRNTDLNGNMEIEFECSNVEFGKCGVLLI